MSRCRWNTALSDRNLGEKDRSTLGLGNSDDNILEMVGELF